MLGVLSNKEYVTLCQPIEYINLDADGRPFVANDGSSTKTLLYSADGRLGERQFLHNNKLVNRKRGMTPPIRLTPPTNLKPRIITDQQPAIIKNKSYCLVKTPISSKINDWYFHLKQIPQFSQLVQDLFQVVSIPFYFLSIHIIFRKINRKKQKNAKDQITNTTPNSFFIPFITVLNPKHIGAASRK